MSARVGDARWLFHRHEVLDWVQDVSSFTWLLSAFRWKPALLCFLAYGTSQSLHEHLLQQCSSINISDGISPLQSSPAVTLLGTSTVSGIQVPRPYARNRHRTNFLLRCGTLAVAADLCRLVDDGRSDWQKTTGRLPDRQTITDAVAVATTESPRATSATLERRSSLAHARNCAAAIA